MSTLATFKQDWLTAAGVPRDEWYAADRLITKESGWHPNSVNKHSGACGLGQQLPCGKWPHPWNEPVGALKDTQAYIRSRYGTWANALRWHIAHNWY